MELNASGDGARGKLPYIDAMRGIAILMVILVHTSQNFPGASAIPLAIAAYGQMGVQLFFVASAFTLCASWDGRSGERNQLLNYGIRRYFRIAPLYYLGIALYFALAVFGSGARGHLSLPEAFSLANVAANLLFLHGFYPPANNNLVPGGWSIGTEVAFYALFPLLFSVFRRLADAGLGALLAGVLLSVGLSQLGLLAIGRLTGETVGNNTFLYYNLLNQLPVFAIGMALYFCGDVWSGRRAAVLHGMLLLILTTTSVALWSTGVGQLFSLIPFVSGLSFASLLVVLREVPALAPRALQRIGELSYSMYVFHFLFAHKLSHRIGPAIERQLGADAAMVVCFFVAVALSCLVAACSERYIERRFIDVGRRLIARRQAGR